jgi:hypothetical protein
VITAEQVLYVLAGCQEPPLAEFWFCVIISGAHHRWSDAVQKVVETKEPNYWPFERGELLVLSSEYGREPFGEGRKPSKWSVGTYQTQNFEAAKALSELVRANTRLREGYYRWDGSAWWRPDDQAYGEAHWSASLDGAHNWAHIGGDRG